MKAFASLSSQQVRFPLGIHRGVFEASAPIEPITIVDAPGARHLDMTFDLGAGVGDQQAITIGEGHPFATQFPVAPPAPAQTFMRVAVSGPLVERV